MGFQSSCVAAICVETASHKSAGGHGDDREGVEGGGWSRSGWDSETPIRSAPRPGHGVANWGREKIVEKIGSGWS